MAETARRAAQQDWPAEGAGTNGTGAGGSAARRWFSDAAAVLMLAGTVAAGPVAAPAAQSAERLQEGQFDLVLRGIRAAVLTYRGAENAGSYAVSGRLESAGLAHMMRRMRYDAKVQGRRQGARFLPGRYEEEADTGKRQQRAVMAWRGGVPVVEKVLPAREAGDTDLDPATQRGTVDPLTALYATLRDVPAGEACRSDVTMFDGRRRSQLRLSAPEASAGQITCAGEYRRLAGFSEREMAERSRFPFRLTYAPAEGGMVRVVEVSMETIYGRAVLRRR